MTDWLTDDVSIDLHLAVLLRQLESLIIALRQHQEVDGWAVVVQAQEEPEAHANIEWTFFHTISNRGTETGKLSNLTD